MGLTLKSSRKNLRSPFWAVYVAPFVALFPRKQGTYERRWKFVPQIHADLAFQACIALLRCFRPVAPIRKILVYAGMLPCLVPSWPQIMQICISFQPRSDLVLDADNALHFLSDLVLQACISFCSVSDKSGAFLFSPCSHKNAVAHISGGFETLNCRTLEA